MRSSAAIRDAYKLKRGWMFLLLAAVACCAMPVEGLGITSHWKKEPGSASLQIEAVFSGGKRTINGMELTIRNTGDSAATIDWDACSLTLPSGRTERIVHTGVMYLLAAMPQASITIPSDGYIMESIWPADLATWRRPFLWGLVGEPMWVKEGISVPNPGGTLGLFLTWSDSTGKHDGMWMWTIQREPPSYLWLYILGGLLALGLVGQALGLE